MSEFSVTTKFNHLTNTVEPPNEIAAELLKECVNAEVDDMMCVEIYPNSTLYDDDAVLEAML